MSGLNAAPRPEGNFVLAYLITGLAWPTTAGPPAAADARQQIRMAHLRGVRHDRSSFHRASDRGQQRHR
jgi:hypothetical protein